MKLMKTLLAVVLGASVMTAYANEEMDAAGAAAGDGGLSLAAQAGIGLGSAAVLTGVVISESDDENTQATTGTN